MIYLDYNATTPIDPGVYAAMLPFMEKEYGNPSSMCTLGRTAAHALMEARSQVAALIGARSCEVLFTSGATESIATAFHSALSSNPSKRHIVTSTTEHSATRNLCHEYETLGYEITELSVDSSGMLSLDALEETISPSTALLSLIWANNETGVIFPIEKIIEITQRKKVTLHLDAVQAIGKIPIDLSKLPIDYLSLSGHKIYAPKGIGALYVHRHTLFRPLFPGSQENGRRGGTENVASCIALGKAAELAHQMLLHEMKRECALRDRLEKTLLEKIEGVSLNGVKKNRLSNTSNLCFHGIQAVEALLLLDLEGLCCSAGSACNTKSKTPSHVLSAMGLTHDEVSSSLRFSVGRFSTEEEIDHALNIIPRVVQKLRELAP
ncbi:MAG: aminotransferase class V-fold PLP-dependent enzyme [Verrucomicrobiae bacterium]|jgi:cysteine desulfurase|nr:aminotransferase class V-fold PLP-dependent enzyme [Verrucomicrobiae bacterium]